MENFYLKTKEKMFPSSKPSENDSFQADDLSEVEANAALNPDCTCHTGVCGCEKKPSDFCSHE